ncbi:MAG: HEAT repeat domain-containing protein, partial [Anaerolineaceae bacterium]|nr:HEAT repeat domain-containing protein [Anaerolineaceae bacterium]
LCAWHGDLLPTLALLSLHEFGARAVQKSPLPPVLVVPPCGSPLLALLKLSWLVNEDVEETVVEALVRLCAPAIEPLVDLLHDKDNAIRISAALSLEQLGWFQSKISSKHLHNILQRGWYFGDLTRINPLLDVMSDPGLSAESKKSGLNTLMQSYYSVETGQFKTCSCGYPNLTDLLDYKEISFEYEDYAERREVYYCPNCMALLYKPIAGPKVVMVIE